MGHWTRDSIEELLSYSDVAVERAIIALYKRQTDYEQMKGTADEANNRGFNKPDSSVFTRMARQLMRSNLPQGKRLSSKQLSECRYCAEGTDVTRIGKYSKQLLRIVEEKERQDESRRIAC